MSCQASCDSKPRSLSFVGCCSCLRLVSNSNLTMIMNVFLKRGNFFSKILFKKESREYFCLLLLFFLHNHRQQKCNRGAPPPLCLQMVHLKIKSATKREECFFVRPVFTFYRPIFFLFMPFSFSLPPFLLTK